MDRNDSSDYYEHRAAQARGLAERAASNAVRNIHVDMAERYMQLAQRAAPERPVLMVVGSSH